MDATAVLEQIIFPLIDEFSDSAPFPERFKKLASTPLFGPIGALDSISFVSFILAVESKARECTGKRLRIFEPRAFAQTNNPFADLGAVAVYLSRLIEQSSCSG